MLVKASALTEAHVRYAARHELARALFLDAEAALLAAPEVARILAQELGHDEAWSRATLAEFEAVAAHYRLA
ncbi:glycerol-3-phosphate dehydrogenase [Bordetella pertussis]|nr:glycerol-3-phosphate dehydrogenase [Bordetella pertussis]